MWGKAEIEISEPPHLIRSINISATTSESLDVEVELLHSNIQGEILNTLFVGYDGNVDIVVINPVGLNSNAG